MNYVNGRDILPPDLLKELQKYVNGELIYIPKVKDEKLPWGALSGAKAIVENRNRSIIDKYLNGTSFDKLQEEFCLSESSIRKIIYCKRKKTSLCN